MARFSRFLVGGVVGAGLALLFSPKSGREIRRLLTGGERRALPAAEEAYPEPSGSAQPESPSAQPEPPAVATPAPGVDLEAKIEETRRQVEAEIEEAFTPGPTAEEEAAAAEEEPVAALPPVAEEPVLEEEAVEEEAEAPAEEKDSWEALKTPVEGEPTAETRPALEAELTVTPEAEQEPPQPRGMDREEMRRRIDETRARLKAKAFDAMVSGETFIDETEAEKAGKHEEAATPGVEKEVEEKIDQSLREQD